jgi:hypothetical protein
MNWKQARFAQPQQDIFPRTKQIDNRAILSDLGIDEIDRWRIPEP